MDMEMDSFIQLKNFLTETGLITHGTIIQDIEAIVEYKSKRGVEISKALVSFTMEGAYHCGDIEIDSKNFPHGRYHTGFNTTYQTYIFDEESSSLIIQGKSAMMRGDYEVKITYRE